jgi:RsiW-degrading membrane proteinase PrsW (M82 family)
MPGAVDTGSTLLTTALMVVFYLVIVRLVDMNEKEPLWAMAVFFVLGAAASVVVVQTVGTPVLDLQPMLGAVIKESARFGAIGAGVLGLLAYGRKRGWDEFNGLLDGIVYGATVGLGFATAREVMNQVLIGGFAVPGEQAGLLAGFHKVFLTGLAEGIFGAIIGAGIGAAVEARAVALRVVWPLVGAGVAMLASWGYVVLGKGNALGGDQGLVRAQLALALPVVVVAVVVVYALLSERRAIRDQLSSEQADGIVTPTDLSLLQSVMAREVTYLKTLLSGKVRPWLLLKTLHNRQVQLAFVKQSAARETNPARKSRFETEIANLRQCIREQQKALEAAGVQTKEEGKP